MSVDVDKDLKPSPDNHGWVLGWGVVSTSPWCLKGVYANKEKAEAESEPGMKVVWGEHKLGSDDFVYSATDQRG
ncbi:MAG: hypothetical protein VX796_05735 [Pseudomonadota bacterium]|nr:hypothetical protein [Pseudomonadota bacterium]